MSYHVNDLFNFEAIDRLFPQRSNFILQKQTKDVISKQEKITCQHVRHISVSNTIPRYKGPFWSVTFPLSINSSKFSTEVLHTKFDLPYLSRKCSTERKFGRQSLQYKYSNMSKSGENHWFGY